MDISITIGIGTFGATMKISLLLALLVFGCGHNKAYLKGLEQGECIAAIEWKEYLKDTEESINKNRRGRGEDQETNPTCGYGIGGLTMQHIWQFKYYNYEERCKKIATHLEEVKSQSNKELILKNPLPGTNKEKP